ncbi:hypothetical protein DICVIV_05823 [Dictyocaulus viviparus]|uniref:EamA domain-containing protein n=1 Tax=Dictyocaulus viviparus TaxID=29172 RepID=A0A0D8XU70_DICVI|nr:hypothetical protein DICVIV_05823 [Dictyocaulus viviparus]
MQEANLTTHANEQHSAGVVILGYVGLIVACSCFGTMFTPLRRKDTKDGFFVQWVECSVVLVVGFIINAIRGFPSFEWIAAIGGVLYAIGNVFSVPAVNGLGMGIAFLIWGSMQIIVGWSVSRFGLFGILAPTEVKKNVLNYIGMVVTLTSGVLFLFVKHTNEKSIRNISDDSTARDKINHHTTSFMSRMEENQFLRNLSWIFKGCENSRVKYRYVLMTLVLATLHGLMMTPIEILKQRNPSNDSYQVFDYIWSFYSTVFVFSTIFFILYCIIRREKAYVSVDLVLPSVGYGILWTSGMTLWLLSGNVLSQVIAYPIATRLPAIISAVLDVLVYKSITGRYNVMFLALAVCVGITGVILIGLSNQNF